MKETHRGGDSRSEQKPPSLGKARSYTFHQLFYVIVRVVGFGLLFFLFNFILRP